MTVTTPPPREGADLNLFPVFRSGQPVVLLLTPALLTASIDEFLNRLAHLPRQ
jgi:hypothetical protein